jgi:hypothetical protein
MITRDFSPIPFKSGKLPFTDRLRGMLQFGFSWPANMESQEVVIRYLKRYLDNSYTLLRNVSLPDLDITVPFILVGPPGITVIYNDPSKGIFRAQGNKWTTMGQSGSSFKTASPNLITRTNLMTKAVQTFVAENGYPNLPVEGMLLFTNPGTHVDTVRPDVRIVLSDAVERFASRLKNEQPVARQDERFRLIRTLTGMAEKQAEPEQPTEEDQGARDSVAQSIQSIDSGFSQAMSPLRRTFNFSKQQWFLLGAFVLAEVILLILFLVIIIVTA